MKKYLYFIDDDEMFLHIINRTCRKIDNISKVETSKNGKEALEKINYWLAKNEDLPDVMFIDINMPVMDGFEFLKEYKDLREKIEKLKKIIPVVMLTSSQHVSDKEKVMAYGIVDEYVPKPFDTQDLEKEIRRFV